MIDRTKRSTLKMMGMATAAVALPTGALLANNEAITPLTAGGTSPHLGVSDLKIEIITSSDVKHNTVILSNLSDDTLPIKHFSPGSVIWEDQYLDLNGLRGHVGLTLAVGSAMNLSVRRQTLKHSFQSEYIWADDAVNPIDQNTSRLLLGAYLHKGQLHAYPIPTINQFA